MAFHKNVASITEAEHISPDKTGDNIEAKKLAAYGYDTDAGVWRRIKVDSGGQVYVEGTIVVDSITGAVEITNDAGNPIPVNGTVATSVDRAGSPIDLKDTTGYGDALTTGIAAVGGRMYNGTNYDRIRGDATNGLLVNLGANNDVTVTEAAPSTVVSFVQTIDTAGVAEQLETNTCVAGVLQAPSTNTGVVYIGGSGVSSSDFGSELQPGQSTGIAIDNTNKLYADVATSGDKIAFLGS